MSDFSKAIQLGVQAAADAAANKEEIRNVVGELANELSKFSDGKLKLVRNTRVVPHENLAVRLGAVFSHIPQQMKAYLTVCLADESTGYDIAEYEVSKNGYPLKINFSDQNISAYDREGLERALSGVVSHPDTGKAITSLIAKAKEKEEEKSLEAEREEQLALEVAEELYKEEAAKNIVGIDDPQAEDGDNEGKI